MLTKPFLSYHHELEQAGTVWVALSGGLDSTVLLHTLASDKSFKPKLKAIHVHHGLLPEAGQWSRHCREYCRDLGIGLTIKKLAGRPPTGESVEAWAREQRYGVFSQLLKSHDVLLTAHHLDDQAETVLLNVLRGAGPSGLSGIAASRALGKGRLLRPLLTVTRADLLQYAHQHQLSWIDDPSNQDTRFDRNFIRREVLPLLHQRWPQVNKQLTQTALHCQAENQVVLAWAQEQLPGMVFDDGGLNIPLLQTHPVAEQHILLRAWLRRLGQRHPSMQWLQQLQRDVLNAKVDAQPILKLGTGEVRRFNQRLYWLATPPAKAEPYQLAWDGRRPLNVPGWPEPVSKQTLAKQGVAIDAIDWQTVQVCSRHHVKRCSPKGWQHSQTIKKCFQAFNVPSWLRDSMPIVMEGGCVLVVIDGWLCEH